MLELKSISKSFLGIKALDDVSMRFAPGKIHALVGENGAGKSTTIKIITGIYRPDDGEIIYDGKPLHFKSYRDSLEQGINIVYQEIQVIPDSSIAENIMLDKMITYGSTGVINWRAIHQTAGKYMRMVGLDMPTTTRMRHLSAAHKQLTQIAKALAADAKVLLLDEPTSSLTDHEAQNLFKILRQLRAAGVTIIFVSHKFEEVFALCDQASVLRDGKCIGTKEIAELTIPELVKMMIGRSVSSAHMGRLAVDKSTEVLRVENLNCADRAEDINFTLHEGEILGFYGLVGSGRTETARLIIGEDKLESGKIFIRGKQVNIRSVAEAVYQHRIGYVTENRKEEGLLLKSSVQTNITLPIWPRIINKLTRAISRSKEAAVSQHMAQAMQLKANSLGQKVEELSGGNQQKISIGKWLAADCDILIIDEPTVGVDVGAKEQIHQLIWDLARQQKKSIILISSDMPEIIRLATRILVFKDQRIVGEIPEVDDPANTYEKTSTAIGHYLA
ncbi:MAG: sugar ABC transporter ATP-binding protein [Planctomycetota bacterium]|nr:sugar ABC transporter ATP-binding protein [Planctomycetota bacterium]